MGVQGAPDDGLGIHRPQGTVLAMALTFLSFLPTHPVSLASCYVLLVLNVPIGYRA